MSGKFHIETEVLARYQQMEYELRRLADAMAAAPELENPAASGMFAACRAQIEAVLDKAGPGPELDHYTLLKYHAAQLNIQARKGQAARHD